MLTRLTHSAIAFAITVVVYQAYVLLAAPLVEPPLVVKVVEPLTPDQIREGRKATHKHRDLLTAYFPPQHWTLTKPPITIEIGKTMIVLDESDNYKPGDDGQLRVQRCVMLFFPRGRVRGEIPPRDAVILEAPDGAVLQMDEGGRRSLTSMGSLQWAKLMGQITIRSDMRKPGPEDDLLLTTRDLYMNEDLIRTDDDVDMRLGPHHGRGRELEIRLVEVERGRSDSNGPNIGGIDSLEILQDVEAQLLPGQVQLGLQTGRDSASPDAPPIKITCDGRFRFDFSSQKATFTEQVRLQQVHPQGQLDQLQCEELSVYFSSDASVATAPATPAEPAAPLGKLSPGLIEAVGKENSPVVLNAQSQQASARCGRMRIELASQRVTFDRGPEVVLRYQDNEIHAKQIQYQAPPKNSPHRVGNLLAAGSGWLRASVSGKGASDKPGADYFEVRWTENMRLRRINGQPVLSLNGRPLLDMVGMGRLWADHLDLYLRERAIDGSEADLLPGDLVPARLVASGNIAIDAAQLRGEVKQLEVQFEYIPTKLLLASPDGNNLRAGSLGRGGLGRSQRSVGNTRAYDIVGETLKMLLTIRDRQPEVTSIDVDGKVVFSESSVQAGGGQPLRVVADHLRIKNADSPSAEISLEGKPATITASGLSIRTESLNINRGTSRAWVDAPGQIELLVDRDLSGKVLPAPQPMVIHWQQGMRLDQDRITFDGDVHVQTTEGVLDTQKMIVQLSAPVKFDGASNQQRTEIAQLQCSGGVNAQFSQRDAMGLTSVQTIKLEESFLANLQTGLLSGEGPGLMESVHLSSGGNPLDGLAPGNGSARLASARPSVQPQASQRLRYLGVQFVRGIRGSLHSHRVKVFGNVEAVYGPVDAWEQRLELTKRGMPGPETIWISSQSLGVAESPLHRLDRNKKSGLGPIELLAEGDVTIEGSAGQGGTFTTHSKFAKYDQLKTLFVLEGDNRMPATLTHQEYRGAQPSTVKARKITYNQSNGKKSVEGLMGGQFRQLAPANGR